METKAGFTLLILSALAFLLDGFSGVFLCLDLISGGSVVTFDNGNDGHGDGGNMAISIGLRCLSPHSVCFEEGGMGVFYGGDGGLDHQPSSNTSFDLSSFAHGGGDGADGGGEIVEIDEILKKEEAPSLATTATFVSVGDDVGKTVARASTPLDLGLNGLGLDQLGFNLFGPWLMFGLGPLI